VAFEELLRQITLCADSVHVYTERSACERCFAPRHLEEGVLGYLRARGKSLRAALVMFCCGAVGGDPERAVPAAAAVEVFHAFSLVHDDIIDNDLLRRGAPTIHELFRDRAAGEFGVGDTPARHYGVSVGILAGDAQQGWATAMLADLQRHSGVRPDLCLDLIERLSARVLPTLVEGELLDVQYSLQPVGAVSEEQICDMMAKKTGALYEYAAVAGALIGLGSRDGESPPVRALAGYARSLGLAFQIRDDILGVAGDESRLGKPVGSDLREGKRTLLICHALSNTAGSDREFLVRRLGEPDLNGDEMARIGGIIDRAGSVGYAQGIAQRSVDAALAELGALPQTRYRDLLAGLAEYVMRRTS
jgi:geranylgeranyl diphosphate synthase type I